MFASARMERLWQNGISFIWTATIFWKFLSKHSSALLGKPLMIQCLPMRNWNLVHFCDISSINQRRWEISEEINLCIGLEWLSQACRFNIPIWKRKIPKDFIFSHNLPQSFTRIFLQNRFVGVQCFLRLCRESQVTSSFLWPTLSKPRSRWKRIQSHEDVKS